MRAWAATLVCVLILGVVGCSTTPILRDPPRVEHVTPPPTQPARKPPPLLGRWYGASWSTLDIRQSRDGLWWIWNSSGTWGYLRADGTALVVGDQVLLVGTGSTACDGGDSQYTFTLKWDGAALRGTMTGCSTVPVHVEFTRSIRAWPL